MKTRIGIRTKIVMLVATAAIIGAVGAWLFTRGQVHANITDELHQRALLVAGALQALPEVFTVATGGETSQHETAHIQAQQINRVLQQLVNANADLAYLMLVAGDNRPEAWAVRNELSQRFPLDTPEMRTQLVNAHLHQSGDRELTPLVMPVHLGHAIHLGSDAGSRADTGSKAASPPAIAKIPDAAQSNRLPAPSTIHDSHAPTARLLIAFAGSRRRQQIDSAILAALIFSGVVITILLWIFFGRHVGRIRSLQHYAHNLAAGDLTQRGLHLGHDELGTLAQTLATVTQNLGETISRVRVASLELDSLSAQVNNASEQIAGDAGTQSLSVRDTSEAIALMSEGGIAVDIQVSDATRCAEASAHRVREIGEAIETIAASVHQIATALNQGERHLRENRKALEAVEGQASRLNEAAENTAAAMTQMTASVRSVEHNAEKAENISRQSTERASDGVEAVGQTREGVEKIHSVTKRSVETIQFLAEKVASIESILGVINDIANQTKLLSLNASIIASQAGEHGKGFLVVAGEIKALAAKTAGSTGEITQVINEVLNVSGKAIDVVNEGVATVDEAMARSEHANEVLSEILETNTNTTSLVRSIAISMAEHATGAARVDSAMQDVHATAVELKRIIGQQNNSSRELDTSMNRMREFMSRALLILKEQATQVEDALSSVRSIFEQVRSVADSNQEQASSRDQATRAFEVLANLSDRNRESARSLASAVSQAMKQAQALSEGVQSFRV